MTGPHDHLDLQTAADALGVHYQTAYRWVRSGKLPAAVVDGRYEIRPEDLESVRQERAAPHRPKVPGPARLDRTAERLYAALTEGDESTVVRTVRRLLAEGTPVADLCQLVLAPPLRRIGDEWVRGEATIWVEHRASAIVERVLGDITPNPRGRRRGTAVVAAVSGDRHSLPTTMATLALRDDNWRVEQLGADVPIDELIDCCSAAGADLAVITVSNPEVAPRADEAAGRLRAAGTPTLVGTSGARLDALLADARATTASR